MATQSELTPARSAGLVKIQFLYYNAKICIEENPAELYHSFGFVVMDEFNTLSENLILSCIIVTGGRFENPSVRSFMN